jgi:hypothetical protein
MYDMSKRDLTIRRSLQQVKHCVEEALAVVEANEDRGHAVNDLEQAVLLIKTIIMPKLSGLMPPNKGG